MSVMNNLAMRPNDDNMAIMLILVYFDSFNKIQ